MLDEQKLENTKLHSEKEELTQKAYECSWDSPDRELEKLAKKQWSKIFNLSKVIQDLETKLKQSTESNLTSERKIKEMSKIMKTNQMIVDRLH